ncbi:hypothetical protein [Streptomyces sp. DB-54]
MSAAVQAKLGRRNAFLQPVQGSTAVLIRVTDGSADGFLIGWVEQHRDPYRRRSHAWTAHWRQAADKPGYWDGLIDAPYSEGTEWAGEELIDRALELVLSMAAFGDVLATRERATGRYETYTATIHEERAQWLGSLDLPKGITRVGRDKVRLTNMAVAYFRGAPQRSPYVDANNMFYFDQWEDPYPLTREPRPPRAAEPVAGGAALPIPPYDSDLDPGMLTRDYQQIMETVRRVPGAITAEEVCGELGLDTAPAAVEAMLSKLNLLAERGWLRKTPTGDLFRPS